VATDADRLAFFLKHDPGSGDTFGTVEIYLRGADGSWSLEQELFPDLAPVTAFADPPDARVVVLSGARLAIGAPRFNGGDGRVIVYARTGSTWAQVQVLGSARAANDFDRNFGSAVALDGDTLVVSEPPSSGNMSSPLNGEVHVYTWNGSLFVLSQSITAPSPSGIDLFGRGLALLGDYLAIIGEPSGGGRTVRVFRRSGGLFSETWTLSGSDVPQDVGLAFDGDRLAIGSPTFAVGSAADVGAVRIYQRQPDDTFVESTDWIPFDYAAGRRFGSQVAFTGGHIIATNSSTAPTPRDVYSIDL
jgi:hypothetical protein